MKYLMSLAYAGERGVVCESLAKDMFLDAMDNPQLSQRVLDQQPNNIDEAYNLASRMDTYTACSSTATARDSFNQATADKADRKSVRSVAVEGRSGSEVRQIQHLESELADSLREIRQLRADNEKLRTAAQALPPPVQFPAVPPPLWWPPQPTIPPFPYAWGAAVQAVPQAVPEAAQSTVPMDRNHN